MQESRLGTRLRLGVQVLIGLAVLTVTEYAISAALPRGAIFPLIVIALAKAGLILRYFMHMAQLWRPEEH
ncbi:MAG: cytochrome C oxidase subunit IV family protein [Chloroflexi bacterium]|nr:cytochrome C oxidase subunit IV family protein [Chloroflexota bacterium]